MKLVVCAAAALLLFLTASVQAFPQGRVSFTKTTGPMIDFKNCGSASDLVTVNSVTINPNPPQKGEDLEVTGSITPKEDITGGDTELQVKLGFLPVLKQEKKFCDAVSDGGGSCPLSSGSTYTLSIKQEVPSATPGATYTGTYKATDQNGKALFCIEVDLKI